MDIASAIRQTYELMGYGVIDVQPIEGTPIFEMEFVTKEGYFKKPVITFFMVADGPYQCEKQASA